VFLRKVRVTALKSAAATVKRIIAGFCDAVSNAEFAPATA
jgi:hypothetical protein